MNKTWSNTALVAYSALPKIVKELDLTLVRLVKSSFKGAHFKNGVSNMQLIGEIMDVNEEKRKIVNLRYIVSTALNALSEEAKHILVGRFIKQATYRDLADELGVSIRTVFRRFENAQDAFAHNLKICGWTESWLENEYGNDKYISAIRIRFIEGKYYTSQNQ